MPALSFSRSSAGRVRCQASVSSTVFVSGVIFRPLATRGRVAGAGERGFLALGRQPHRHFAPRLHLLRLEEFRGNPGGARRLGGLGLLVGRGDAGVGELTELELVDVGDQVVGAGDVVLERR